MTSPEGERKEIDFVPPEPKVELPAPLCPAGTVSSELPDVNDPDFPSSSSTATDCD